MIRKFDCNPNSYHHHGRWLVCSHWYYQLGLWNFLLAKVKGAVAVFLHWLYHIPRLCADPGTDCTQPPALWRSWSSAAGKHLAVCFLCRSDGGRFLRNAAAGWLSSFPSDGAEGQGMR